MIGPKPVPLTPRQEREAYDIATARNEGICELCRRQPGNRHHRQGRDRFNTIPSNLLLACGSGTTGCHGLIHSKNGWARERGYIVPDWANPAEYPTLYWVRKNGIYVEEWVLLDDMGGMRGVSGFEADRRIDGDWPGVRRAS